VIKKKITLVESYLKEALFEELYGDSVMIGVNPNFAHIVLTCIPALDLTPISSLLLPLSCSYYHAFYKSVCDIRGHNPPLTLFVRS